MKRRNRTLSVMCVLVLTILISYYVSSSKREASSKETEDTAYTLKETRLWRADMLKKLNYKDFKFDAIQSVKKQRYEAMKVSRTEVHWQIPAPPTKKETPSEDLKDDKKQKAKDVKDTLQQNSGAKPDAQGNKLAVAAKSEGYKAKEQVPGKAEQTVENDPQPAAKAELEPANQGSQPAVKAEQKPANQAIQAAAKAEQKPANQGSQPAAKAEQKPGNQGSQPAAKAEQKPANQAIQPAVIAEQKPANQAIQAAAKAEQKPANQGSQPAAKAEQKPGNQGSQPAAKAEQKPANQGSQPAGAAGQKPANQDSQPAVKAEQKPANQGSQPAGAAGQKPAKQGSQPAGAAGQKPANQDSQPAVKAGQKPANQGSQPAGAAGQKPANQGSQPAGAAGQKPAKQGSQPAGAAGQKPANQGSQPASKAGQKPANQGSQPASKAEQKPANQGSQPAGAAGQKPASEGNEQNKQKSSGPVKYLFYLCDDKVRCYGMGDRQRAMVSTYYLAELTGRRVGLMMTSPVNLREFYAPALVTWDITLKDLPKNVSMKEIQVYGKREQFHLDEIDFNTAYPQDVVVLRTNHAFWEETLKNKIYDSKIPQWGRVHRSRVIGNGWLRLMKPTALLRDSLNKALVTIAEKIQEESEVWSRLGKTSCCKKVDLPQKLPLCPASDSTCGEGTSTTECCNKLKAKMFLGCPELRLPCSGVDSNGCADHLSKSFPNRWDTQRVQTLAHNFCTLPAPISKLDGTEESIRSKKGYDLTDMNMVCVHVRVGHSATFSWEKKTRQENVTGLWEFLKGFIQKGYHMYLASDAQEVKDDAKTIFGERLHVDEEEIIHVDYGEKYDDPKSGLLFALKEQLLLATSCKEMVLTPSGFSLRAAEIRNALMGRKASKVYQYRNGAIVGEHKDGVD